MQHQLIKGTKESGYPGFWPRIFPTQDLWQEKDAQGQYYAEAIETRDYREKVVFPSAGVHERRKLRKRRLTKKDIKLALSIVGIIEDGLEPDLSTRFREYLYNND
ncbi:MAG: hypothetical protein AB1491_10870 [Thermodesulfobacteriota bacterium]